MTSGKHIRILLADDHVVLREGLRALVEMEPDMEVVAGVANGRDAIKKTQELAPDVVVMDIGMPELNGIDATRQIKGQQPNVFILCLSVHREERLVAAMLKAGASGYLLKTSARTELVDALRTVASGETYLSPPIAGDVVEHHLRSRTRGKRGAYTALTEREREVLQLVAEGHRTKAIADRLHVSPKTVLTHRENMMKKLRIDSVSGLTRYALREGLAEL
ncbi:MAG: response regulator transcription factor [Verrucomicrobia bacterium]|jgi:DNA-binding NarL/FixJ family response regulator|nr:response regulator transcription factor [Verrucomicrobiota bacterium]